MKARGALVSVLAVSGAAGSMSCATPRWTGRAVIDRIEEETAVVQAEARFLVIRLSELPPGIREGDCVEDGGVSPRCRGLLEEDIRAKLNRLGQ